MLSRALQTLLRPFWRMTRGLTMGAQGVVVDENNNILLVRHGYRPGWHFPGGGVEWGETLQVSLARELREEAGIKLAGAPRLHGVFANFEKFPGDHIAVFIVREWVRPEVPKANMEIRETSFFALDAVPDDMAPGARQRMDEIFAGHPRSETW